MCGIYYKADLWCSTCYNHQANICYKTLFIIRYNKHGSNVFLFCDIVRFDATFICATWSAQPCEIFWSLIFQVPYSSVQPQTSTSVQELGSQDPCFSLEQNQYVITFPVFFFSFNSTTVTCVILFFLLIENVFASHAGMRSQQYKYVCHPVLTRNERYHKIMKHNYNPTLEVCSSHIGLIKGISYEAAAATKTQLWALSCWWYSRT